MRCLALVGLHLFAIAGCAGPKADVSADELATAYRDVSKADSLYKGKTIAVRGTVTFVGGMLGLQYGWQGVSLDGEKRENSVTCLFPPESAKQAERLRVGRQVVIRGLCKGEYLFGGPLLTNCVVAR